jgi:hypothetical protein
VSSFAGNVLCHMSLHQREQFYKGMMESWTTLTGSRLTTLLCFCVGLSFLIVGVVLFCGPVNHDCGFFGFWSTAVVRVGSVRLLCGSQSSGNPVRICTASVAVSDNQCDRRSALQSVCTGSDHLLRFFAVHFLGWPPSRF